MIVGRAITTFNSDTVSPSMAIDFLATSTSPGATTALGTIITISPTNTVTVPILQFNGDTDTGIFQSAADYLNFTTGGTERLTINSAGNVGIGTTSPYARLSIAGSAGDTTPLFVVSTSTSAFATSTAIDIDSSGNLNFNSYAGIASNINLWNTAARTATQEVGVMRWRSNVFEIGTMDGDSVARNLVIGVGSSAGGTPSAGRALTISASTPFYSFGFSTGLTGNLAQFSGSISASSGSQVPYAIIPTVAQTGSGSYTALLIQPTITSIGTGTNYLLRVGTTTATDLFYFQQSR